MSLIDFRRRNIAAADAESIRFEESRDARGNYSSPGLASIDSAVESWDSGVGVVEHGELHKTQVHLHHDDNGQYAPQKHESQLLFYSDVEDSLCPSPLPLPNYNFTNTLQSKYDSSYFFCSKPSLSSKNEYGKYRYVITLGNSQ